MDRHVRRPDDHLKRRSDKTRSGDDELGRGSAHRLAAAPGVAVVVRNLSRRPTLRVMSQLKPFGQLTRSAEALTIDAQGAAGPVSHLDTPTAILPARRMLRRVTHRGNRPPAVLCHPPAH